MTVHAREVGAGSCCVIMSTIKTKDRGLSTIEGEYVLVKGYDSSIRLVRWRWLLGSKSGERFQVIEGAAGTA